MIKDLLIVIDNAKGSEPFLEAAVGFAEQQGALVKVLMISPGPLAAAEFAPFGAFYVPFETMKHEEAQRLQEIRSMLVTAKVPIEVGGICDDVAWVSTDIRQSHPLADLVMIGQGTSWEVPWLRRRVTETLLMGGGTPLLVVPGGCKPGAIRHAVLGWKPTREATRAVHDLVTFAEPGATIDVVVVSTDGQEALRTEHVEDVQRHLHRHGFHVTTNVVMPDMGATVAHMLVRHAVEHKADVVATGGYGHSRIREVMWGGVSRELIAGARVPVLLSH